MAILAQWCGCQSGVYSRGLETVQTSAAVVCECMEAGLGTPGVETLEAGGAGTKSATRTTTCVNRD